MLRAPRTGGWGAGSRVGAVLTASTVVVAAALLAACGDAAPSGTNGPRLGAGSGATPGPATWRPVHRAAAATPLLPVGHRGRWLTDAAGRVLLLHGVNEVVKASPWDPARYGFSDADAAWLAANGVDFVRLGVLPSAALPAPGRVDDAYLGALAAVARTLGRHGVLTLLDVHQDGWGPAFPAMDGFPPWMTLVGGAADEPAPYPNEYTNPAVEQAFASFWLDAPGPGGAGLQEDDTVLLGALAHTFGSLPTLLGYDVLNEPWPGLDASGCGQPDGCRARQAAELAPFYAKADRALRAGDQTHLVLVEPFLQFSAGAVPASLPLPAGDRNSGLSFHAYTPGATANALDWARRSGGALLATEWGASPDPGILDSQAQTLDLALMPSAYWAYDDCCNTPLPADSLLRSRPGPPEGANANSAVVGAVVRPHPLAVAGTPAALSYDPASRELRFSWNAVAAGGGSFDEKSVTSIEVPAALYPSGYTVSVDGAIVTSAPCAPLLTVRRAHGRASASLLVAPGGGCHGGGTGR